MALAPEGPDVQVTIVCRSRLLPRAEQEVSEVLTEALLAEGLTISDGVTYEASRPDGDHGVLTVTVDGAARDSARRRTRHAYP